MKDEDAARRLASRKQLIRAAQRGGITLVLGAGISMPRGIPDWNKLAKSIWRHVFPDRPNPWARQKQGSSPKELPQFLPIIFELAYQKLGESGFLEVLKQKLYARANFPFTDSAFARSKESLAVLARLLAAEHKRGGERRVTSVFTFNADDFIEQAVSRVAGIRGQLIQAGIVGAITRSTHRLLAGAAREQIPVYHVHGFLPSDLWRSDEGPKRMLVFTDLQYWSTSATASSFANRIASSALSEGQCVFIGVSMRDINLLRWLALRTLDRDRDQMDFGQKRLLGWIAQRTSDQSPELLDLLNTVQGFLKDPLASRSRSLDKNFGRHFWIRPQSNDPSGFLSDFLYQLRGVQAVDIDDWRGPSFQKLMAECFPRKSKPR